ncbi:PD-(D/E)XK nuclease-like domain-containing protein [Pseudooceanicola sp. CBS1P-1]|uniref:Putative exodeoxyribonuclease 8 PDDEXK-like domain-containing protein n=1 Tax=Pseudooceanicola albus TaxID=2692189 RepID=A0A6L7G5Z2_9RHOB|nr:MULTISPECIES: PD-(D/E)XK nuclease-like domain-containing protein [Pseudooceanicola]MBT9385506.1 PD-(D/E)XK nuclease-like domain-containing protein [Pseudooceanicola endophyticus]MXN19082.1 hypothetical protein [Pseudooceanicola albus]
MTIEFRTLEPDELITEPGFYRISLDRHHNLPCDGPSVTSGVLRRMAKFAPSKVWARHPLNPDRFADPDSSALRLGRAMAALVEGGAEELQKHFQVLPDDKPARPTKAQLRALAQGRETPAAKKSIAFWSSITRDGRDILSESEFELLVGMGAALAADPAAAYALGGEPEITMAWQDERTGIWCLSRPDNLREDGLLSDYKKVNTQGRPFTGALVDDLIEKHGYHMQLGFADEGWEILTGNKPSQIGLVVQEDDAPYDVILREIEAEAISIGRFENRQALNRFSECLNAGRWPGAGEHVGAYRMSESYRERILAEMQTAGVAP